MKNNFCEIIKANLKPIKTKHKIPSAYQKYWDNFNWELYVKIIRHQTK